QWHARRRAVALRLRPGLAPGRHRPKALPPARGLLHFRIGARRAVPGSARLGCVLFMGAHRLRPAPASCAPDEFLFKTGKEIRREQEHLEGAKSLRKPAPKTWA
ncbi:MAG: hypothetical protein ACRD4O_12975, partial [Bryobacteraceae bacterium]